jgi:hypothetical protein
MHYSDSDEVVVPPPPPPFSGAAAAVVAEYHLGRIGQVSRGGAGSLHASQTFVKRVVGGTVLRG